MPTARKRAPTVDGLREELRDVIAHQHEYALRTRKLGGVFADFLPETDEQHRAMESRSAVMIEAPLLAHALETLGHERAAIEVVRSSIEDWIVEPDGSYRPAPTGAMTRR